MTSIQKKSLEHISKTLDGYETYDIYSGLKDVMAKEGVNNSTINKIIEFFQTAMWKQTEKINESKAWVDLLISDEQ